jgi:hypothetical protein
MQYLGVCGDDCSLCPRYMATQSNDIEQLKKVASLWYRAGFRDSLVSAEEMACHGCQSAKTCAFGDLKNCAKKRNIHNCGECPDYPCSMIQKVFQQVKTVAETCRMKCSDTEFQQLQNAFFSKKERLDHIHKKHDPKN